ncbi:MAG: hypothetical protein KZQ64_05835 [gamma proteobacterium symbiont of Bathyaustriella thionipta]|nr:hypothetical protein [gamma proteobacterium symbiont of Bathyaustriella thionipta]MCU7948598.1 hypothetical protein [gamma proteobacterium symbiont of Bathyaustriella thionipta]MCU7952897.1 hypothetical protein [gamma proteobacterium symbiont of Bathyaustriella thionipta]MCU7955151.1 hypothetical protein [gamma proteobacterium symbiont of Bathyaustriella thionipta]MCU7967449.1 hypothetical protein [gamma proteobacterium symbiont of Bathyaustriella thionipta]
MKLLVSMILMTLFNSAFAIDKQLRSDEIRTICWDNDKRYSVGSTTCQFKGDAAEKYPFRCTVNGYGRPSWENISKTKCPDEYQLPVQNNQTILKLH